MSGLSNTITGFPRSNNNIVIKATTFQSSNPPEIKSFNKDNPGAYANNNSTLGDNFNLVPLKPQVTPLFNYFEDNRTIP